jgi:hypothetical protein
VRGLQHFDPSADPAARWSEIAREMSAQRLVFTSRGFTSATSPQPSPTPARPRRARHVHRGAGVEIEALLDRRDSDAVRVWVHAARASGPAFSGAIVTLASTSSAATLQRFELNAGSLGSSSVADFALAPGQSLVVRVEQGASAARSAPLTV